MRKKPESKAPRCHMMTPATARMISRRGTTTAAAIPPEDMLVLAADATAWLEPPPGMTAASVTMHPVEGSTVIPVPSPTIGTLHVEMTVMLSEPCSESNGKLHAADVVPDRLKREVRDEVRKACS